jgi:hypothetical protein
VTTWQGGVLGSEDDGRATTLDTSGSVVLTGTIYGISTGTLMFRIPGVDVPQGAQIDAATITPTIVLGSGSGSGFVNVFAPLVVDVPALVIGLLAEPRTTSHVVEIAAAGTTALDITAIVQELVDRPGWVPGNAIAVLMTQAPGRGVSARQYDGSPTYAATVSVTWSDAAPPGAQVREMIATTVGAQPSVNVHELTVHTDAPAPVPGGSGRWWGSDQWGTLRPYFWAGDQWGTLSPYVWTGDQWQTLG